MEESTESRHRHTHTWAIAKTVQGEKDIFSTSGTGIIKYTYAKKEPWLLGHIGS